MNANTYENQKLRGLKRKLELISYKGGKCEMCGYNSNIAALEFHHIDPNEKEFQLDARHLSNTSLDKLKKEADKCKLLCANCHRTLHNPDLEIEIVKTLVKDSEKLSFENPKGQICPVCGKSFPKTKGKVYCSEECRYNSKGYPTIEEISEQYSILKSWEKVAQHFGLTRKIINGIRKRYNK